MTFPSTHPALARALTARGYTVPTAVQTAILAEEAANRDLLVSAQTGSGKTVAFGLAMAGTLLGSEERFAQAAQPLALIIAPTRELAVQVQRELAWLYAETGARVVTCVGGMDVRSEARQLEHGAHIVVGTPGRLRDHLERKRLDLTQVKGVVLDEADEMLDMGFREDLELILEATPAARRTLLFSATVPREIETLAGSYQREALRIETARRDQQHADIEYRAIRVAPHDIEHAVVNILRLEEARATLVFCATREAVKRMHARLVERGFSAVALSGELTQGERTHALQALRDGRARVLVATDVAARGLDLPDLALVIHAELPNDHETLLHRSGRTGRAGRKGLCMLIVPYNRRRKMEALLGAARIKATWGTAPTAEEIRTRDQERFLASPIFSETPAEEELALARLLQAGRSADEIALALVRMHRAQLPAPEDLAEVAEPAWRDKGRDKGSDRSFKHGKRQDAYAPRQQGYVPRDRGEQSPGREGGAPRPSRHDSREMVWFRLNIGREKNADPRWLLPLICRAGDVSKAEIGAIKIFDRDTRFQVVAEHADKFADAVRVNGSKQGTISRVGSYPPNTPEKSGYAAPDATAAETSPPTQAETGVRPNSSWRSDERPKGSGPRPHRKGNTGYQPRSAAQHGPRNEKGGPRPPSKYAHKKKNRAGQPAKA